MSRDLYPSFFANSWITSCNREIQSFIITWCTILRHDFLLIFPVLPTGDSRDVFSMDDPIDMWANDMPNRFIIWYLQLVKVFGSPEYLTSGIGETKIQHRYDSNNDKTKNDFQTETLNSFGLTRTPSIVSKIIHFNKPCLLLSWI